MEKLKEMIEKMKGKCLPLKDLSIEQIEKVKEKLRYKNCLLCENIKLNSDYVIRLNQDTIKGDSRYYFKSKIYNEWDCSDVTNLPTQSVKDFL